MVPASPALVKQFRDTFYGSLRALTRYEQQLADDKTRTGSAVEDGTQYLIWYRGEAIVQFDMISTGTASPPRRYESPLLTWMKDVYRKIQQTRSKRERQGRTHNAGRNVFHN